MIKNRHPPFCRLVLHFQTYIGTFAQSILNQHIMKRLIVSLIAILAISAAANAADYTINDDAIDALIEASVEVSPAIADLMPAAPAAATATISKGSDPIAAFIICTFLGGFGVHRHYMGTRPFMWAIYTLTAGGIFGVVPLIDWVFLLVGVVEDNIGQYCGNTKFFMWA